MTKSSTTDDRSRQVASRPSIGPIHHVVINVRDLDVSLRFYRDAVGLIHLSTTDMAGTALKTLLHLPSGATGRVATLSGGRGYGRLELMQWHDASGSAVRTPKERGPASAPDSTLLSFLLPEAELTKMHESLGAMGYRSWSEPVDLDVGGARVKAFIVEDPDGFAIEFFALPPADTAAS